VSRADLGSGQVRRPPHEQEQAEAQLQTSWVSEPAASEPCAHCAASNISTPRFVLSASARRQAVDHLDEAPEVPAQFLRLALCCLGNELLVLGVPFGDEVLDARVPAGPTPRHSWRCGPPSQAAQ
jgi:hypothetical protein